MSAEGAETCRGVPLNDDPYYETAQREEHNATDRLEWIVETAASSATWVSTTETHLGSIVLWVRPSLAYTSSYNSTSRLDDFDHHEGLPRG